MNNTIKILQSYKGKTVEEAIAILQKEEQEINDKQSLLQQNKIEWYKNCIGKYFVIQHNDISFTLVHIQKRKTPNTNHYYGPNSPEYYITWGMCYNVLFGTQPMIKGNAGLNPLWLCNPYEEGKMSSTCKEITKDEFEKITSPFNSIINEAKQILK